MYIRMHFFRSSALQHRNRLCPVSVLHQLRNWRCSTAGTSSASAIAAHFACTRQRRWTSELTFTYHSMHRFCRRCERPCARFLRFAKQRRWHSAGGGISCGRECSRRPWTWTTAGDGRRHGAKWGCPLSAVSIVFWLQTDWHSPSVQHRWNERIVKDHNGTWQGRTKRIQLCGKSNICFLKYLK